MLGCPRLWQLKNKKNLQYFFLLGWNKVGYWIWSNLVVKELRKSDGWFGFVVYHRKIRPTKLCVELSWVWQNRSLKIKRGSCLQPHIRRGLNFSCNTWKPLKSKGLNFFLQGSFTIYFQSQYFFNIHKTFEVCVWIKFNNSKRLKEQTRTEQGLY